LVESLPAAFESIAASFGLRQAAEAGKSAET
jgi:hypothetical protein